MDNDGFAVPAVQCSVIQYCSDNNKVGQEESSPATNIKSEENELLESTPSEIENEKNSTSEELELKNCEDVCTNNIENVKASSNSNTNENSEDSDDKKESIVEESSELKHVKIEPIFNNVSEEAAEINVKIEEIIKKEEDNVPLVNGESESASHVDEYEDEIVESESDEEVVKPRRRGRCKKNPELIPPHLAPDIALGYRMLLKFLETPQFSVFLRPGGFSEPSEEEDTSNKDQITCLNQIKKKFDENSYKRLADFVGDVRNMLSNVYMAPRNPVAVKRALRLEQVLEQRIAQLPNYLRPQCSLVLSEDEISNSPKKIRINKGGGFVSLLLERADKIRTEKDREKRKVLAEERKHLKEEQDKDVQDWEKNVLLKDHEEEIRSMWELPQIGHFIHLCANILNIGDVSQYEVERMLLMPQCSETLDLLMTALLSNSLVRAKLDRTPTMPYSIWLPLVRTRVNAWYRSYQREYGNCQKVFEEVGVEPEFWQIVGTAHSPLDYFYFHEIPLIQRVWILKTLCDVDFVRKKTVYDNVRQQVLEELQGTNLGVDRHGNRYIHFPQFGMTALRIYRQSTIIDTDIMASELVESQVGFDVRKGEITLDKVFRDIWDVGTKNETPKKKRGRKKKTQKRAAVKVEPTPSKSLRISARAKRKVYVDSSDSDFSDTDLATLKTKLTDSPSKPEKTFISLSVFRLPREKVKPVNMKKSYYSRKLEREEAERLRQEELEATKDKLSGDEESNEPRLEEDEDDETKDNFTVKNLQNLKMVLKKGSDDNESTPEESEFKYVTPPNLLPDSRKFYCVVDSVDGLRQLISQFASDENDLEIISRSTLRSGKSSKLESNSPSCEVQLIERLQKLEDDLEAWEMDYIKTSRAIREKLYKEYTNYQTRPSDFVHPNEAYWQNLYDEPVVPETPTVPETVEPVIEAPQPDADTTVIPAPPSPLGGLRPRTRTRQQQQITKLPDEDLDEEDYDPDSPESDDNWEMPVKRRRRNVELRVSVRQSKRSTKKPAKMADFSESDVDDKADKSQKALFWSPRSTDPSEELNWETNRQKILEKHNSPRKVIQGDIDSEISEVENALKTTTVPNLKNRIYPAAIPGNRKPYYSNAQLKAMANKKEDSDNEIDIIGTKPAPKKAVRYTKPVMRKSASTQSSEVIDLDPETQTDKQTVVLQTPVDDHYITDGSVYIKIEYSFVQELMKNQSAVKKFANQLDLNKKIQIVKKKFTQTPLTSSSTTAAASNIAQQRNQQAARMANTNKMINRPPRPTIEQNKPSSNLRFVRPQNVPNPVQIYRPTQRVSAPNQPNYMFVQTSSVRPGLVQVVRPNQNQQPIVAIADKNINTSGTLITSQNILQHQNQDGSNKVEYVEILSQTSNSNPIEIIQVQSSGKQQQYVQVSQGSNVLQTSNSMGQQNILRLSTTAPSNISMQATPSYVRLASTGQIVQIAPTQPSSSLIKSQVETINSGTLQGTIATNPIQNQTSTANQVTLLQVQGLPGEPISYIPVQTGKVGNFVQIQSPQKPIGQLGAIVQMASPQRQSPQVGRVMQLQSPPRPQGVVMQQTSTPGTMVQMQIPKPMVSSTTPRPQQANVTQTVPSLIQANNPQTQPSPRQQTTLVQVYGSPRMQTTTTQGSPQIQTTATQMQASPRLLSTATQMQGSPRLQTIVRNVQNSLQQDNKLSPLKTYSGTEQTFIGSKMQTVITQDNNTKMVVGQDQQLRSVGPTTMTSLPQILQTGNGTAQMVMVQVSQPLQQGPARPSFSNVSTAQNVQQPTNIRQRLQTPQIISSGNVIQLQDMPRPVTNVATQNTPRHTLVSVSNTGQLPNNVRPGLVSLSQSLQSQTNLSKPAGTMITTSQQTNVRPYSNISAITQNTSGVQTVQQMVPRSIIGTNTQVRSSLQRPVGPVYRVSTAPRPTVTSNIVRTTGQHLNTVRSVGVPGLVQIPSDGSSGVETSGVKLGNLQVQNISGQVVRVSAGSQIIQTNANQFGIQTTNAPQVRQVQNVNVVQAGRLPSVRTQYVHVPNSGKPVQISIQETDDDGDGTPGTYRIVSESDHLVRLLTSDPKTVHNYQTQPIIVKATGSRPTKTLSQTVTIDDGDEDLEIVGETVSRANDGFTL